MPLGSSFWTDEIATVFVAHYGANHPSVTDVAPQAWKSLYYFLPRITDAWFGGSEISIRMPSILAMLGLLLLVARLASRLIRPEAAWFAVFACLSLKGLDYHAADAHPYALGMCVAAACLLFLVRWLDLNRWVDAAAFLICGALIWRIHLLFWPFYFVLIIYALVRIARGQTKVGWGKAAAVFGVLGVTLLPVLMDALALFGEATAHVVAAKPSLRDLVGSFKLNLVALCGAGAWILYRWRRWRHEPRPSPAPAALVLILAWWLCQPLLLFAFSWVTGSSLFVTRYLSLSLPGAALTATLAAAWFIPAAKWKWFAAALALAALVQAGDWKQVWPLHHNSDWRAAAAAVNSFEAGGSAPVICPSPFIEAKPPVWRPDYPLPGFLYAPLSVYPIRGKTYLFPFEGSPEAERYAATLSRDALASSPRFVLYGWEPQVHFWRGWFATRPELTGWRQRSLGPFADVDVVVFEPGVASTVR